MAIDPEADIQPPIPTHPLDYQAHPSSPFSRRVIFANDGPLLKVTVLPESLGERIVAPAAVFLLLTMWALWVIVPLLRDILSKNPGDIASFACPGIFIVVILLGIVWSLCRLVYVASEGKQTANIEVNAKEITIDAPGMLRRITVNVPRELVNRFQIRLTRRFMTTNLWMEIEALDGKLYLAKLSWPPDFPIEQLRDGIAGRLNTAVEIV